MDEKNGEKRENGKIRLCAVVGPTASGKTALSVELAKLYNCEIISADSMQIYKALSISTAKPTAEEMRGVPHHLMDFISVTEDFSVARYVELASGLIDDIVKRKKLPMLCGGTGLYVSSLIDKITFSPIRSDVTLREALKRYARDNSNGALLEKLRRIDPQCAKRLHENDVSRIIRAIEVFELTGITMTQHMINSREAESPYAPLIIGLDFAERAVLYDRINRRVDQMVKQGIVDEARAVLSQKLSKTASQAIGIKEFRPYFNGEMSLEDCVKQLKTETRRYAKRQLTWFRRDKRIKWIIVRKEDKFENILEKAKIIMEMISKECYNIP